MQDDDPIAFFITWTLYGTYLQGDQRGWRRRKHGSQLPRQKLAAWRCEKLKHSVELLDLVQRAVVEAEVDRLAAFRSWHVWAHTARTNHVHVVVTANGYSGKKVRDQLKANCTRVLRERWPQWIDRPVWTTGGDWRCLNNEQELSQVVVYVNEAQDHQPQGLSLRSDDTNHRI